VTVSPGELTTRILHNKKAVERWCKTKALTIDEISLLHGRMLDLMNAVAQAVRGIETPFGGMQGGGFLPAATSG
jgi:ATP-dependent DNA helicase PIF1